MKIIDYWAAAYYSLVRKFGKIGIIKTNNLLQYFWGMNIASLICCLFPFIKCSKNIGFAGINIISLTLGILLALKIRNRLDERYQNNFDIITEYSSRIPKIVSVLILVLHFLITIALVIFGPAVVYRFTR